MLFNRPLLVVGYKTNITIKGVGLFEVVHYKFLPVGWGYITAALSWVISNMQLILQRVSSYGIYN